MQEHCIEKQTEAHARMSDLYGRLKSRLLTKNPVLFEKSVDVIERCMGRWARGSAYDWTMVDHCTEKQLRAAMRLAEQAERRRAPEPTIVNGGGKRGHGAVQKGATAFLARRGAGCALRPVAHAG